MSSPSPERKKQKLSPKISFQDLSVNELGLIFSFLEKAADNDEDDDEDEASGSDCWPSKLRPLFCREWSKVTRTFPISSAEHYSALAFCPDALLRKIYLLRFEDQRYLHGQGSNVNLQEGGGEDEADGLDPRYISRFSLLEHLHIEGAQMEGSYPFIFNSFGHLRTLTMKSVRIKFNLDMLSSIPLLEEIEFSNCDELKGTLSSLDALKRTLQRIHIVGCKHVTGDFMALSDFPKLEWLILSGSSSVSGDVRNLRVDHFLNLSDISLPSSVYGARIIENIADAYEIMESLSSLLRRQPSLFQGHRWLLSENSPDFYPSIPDYAAPFTVEFVTEGNRLGWRWSSGGKGAMAYPPFEGGFWIVHCETNWIHYPDSNNDDEPFSSIVDCCSSHLRYGEVGAPLVPFKGFYEPPSEEQYRNAIQEATRCKMVLQQISNPNFDPIDLFRGDIPLVPDFGSNGQYLLGDNQNNGGSEAGAELAVAAASMELDNKDSTTQNNASSEAGAELAVAAAMELESDEDSRSDVIDFGIEDIHITTDPERQLNILSTYILTDKNVYPCLTWRAFWSMEKRHDVMLGGIRKKHFHRWPRASIPEDDPYRDEESDAIFFPGMYASHDAKCAWVGMVVEECAANDMRPAFDMTWERDYDIPSLEEAPTVISDILLACAPDHLSVCLYIDRSMVESFVALATVKKDEKRKTSISFSSSMTKEERDAMHQRVEKSKRNPGIEDIKKFLSSPYIRDDVPSHIKLNTDEDVSDQDVAEKLEKFKQWLKEEATSGGTLHHEEITQKLPPRRYDKLGMSLSGMRSLNGTKGDLVLFARYDDIPRDMKSNDVLDDMIVSLGLYKDIVGVNQTSSRNPDIHGYSYITSELIGGNIHYPDVGGRASVAFTWSSTQKLTEEHVQEKQNRLAFDTEFVRNAEAKKEASNGQLCFILWPRVSNGHRGGLLDNMGQPVSTNGLNFPPDTIAIGCDNAHMIWLPGDYDCIEEKIYNYCVNGGGDIFSSGLRFITTHSGNKFWEAVFAYFLKTIVKGRHLFLEDFPTIPNKDSLQLCLLLGLTRTLIESAEDFFLDHEYPMTDIKDFFDALSIQWRKVLLESDETLGLGTAGDPDSGSASREGLYVMLDFYSSRFELCFTDMVDVLGDNEDHDDVGTFEFAPFPPRD